MYNIREWMLVGWIRTAPVYGCQYFDIVVYVYMIIAIVNFQWSIIYYLNGNRQTLPQSSPLRIAYSWC